MPRTRPRALLLLVGVAVVVLGCGRIAELADLGSDPGATDPAAAEVQRRERALDGLIERLDRVEPSGEVLLRLSLTGGWGLPASGELHLTIEDDGRVVRVTDTSVFSSTDDFTSARLSRDGIRRVLALTRELLPAPRSDLDGGAGVSPTDRSAWLEVGDEITLSMDQLGQTEGRTAGQRAWRARFDAVIERIADLSWLGDDIVEPERAWTPDSMTVLARSLEAGAGADTGSPAVRWPLDRPLSALAVGTTIDAQGQERSVVCLEGADVVPVFALLTGVNRASLRVDDGAAWELEVRPHMPGYRLVGDPCQ
jgi:hypothetical protein